MKGEIIATIILIGVWILEIIFDNWFIHLLFILSWGFVLYLVIKFIREVISWRKKLKFQQEKLK